MGIELMGYNVNNYLKVIVVQMFLRPFLYGTFVLYQKLRVVCKYIFVVLRTNFCSYEVVCK